VKAKDLEFVILKVEGRPEELATVTLDTTKSLDSKYEGKLKEIKEQMRAKIRERGATTIQGLGRHFKILDDNSDWGISDREFVKALREYGFSVSWIHLQDCIGDSMATVWLLICDQQPQGCDRISNTISVAT
jgi:hypothetical protein